MFKVFTAATRKLGVKGSWQVSSPAKVLVLCFCTKSAGKICVCRWSVLFSSHGKCGQFLCMRCSHLFCGSEQSYAKLQLYCLTGWVVTHPTTKIGQHCLTRNILGSMVKILNSNPVPVTKQNIDQFCFANPNKINIGISYCRQRKKSKVQLPPECVQVKHGEPCLSFTSNPHSLWYGVVQDMKHGEPCLSLTSNPHSLWYGVVQDMEHCEPCLSFTSNPHSLWYGVVQDMKHGEPCLSLTSNPHSLWYGVAQDIKS